jgi:hypothetical protein
MSSCIPSIEKTACVVECDNQILIYKNEKGESFWNIPHDFVRENEVFIDTIYTCLSSIGLTTSVETLDYCGRITQKNHLGDNDETIIHVFHAVLNIQAKESVPTRYRWIDFSEIEEGTLLKPDYEKACSLVPQSRDCLPTPLRYKISTCSIPPRIL